MADLALMAVAAVIGALLGRFLSPTEPDTVVSRRLTELEDSVRQLETAEADRSAAVVDSLDKFDRLFKRMVARQQRDAAAQDAPQSTNGTREGSESDLSFRERLRANRRA